MIRGYHHLWRYPYKSGQFYLNLTKKFKSTQVFSVLHFWFFFGGPRFAGEKWRKSNLPPKGIKCLRLPMDSGRAVSRLLCNHSLLTPEHGYFSGFPQKRVRHWKRNLLPVFLYLISKTPENLPGTSRKFYSEHGTFLRCFPGTSSVTLPSFMWQPKL